MIPNSLIVTDLVFALRVNAKHSYLNEASLAAAHAQSDPVSVLLVDDDREFCSLASCYMQQLSYCVTNVANGMLALDRLDRAPFDVLVIDCAMPPGTLRGAALGRMARCQFPHSIIIFITKHPAIMEFEVELPGPILIKPIDLSKLHAVISTTLDAARKS
jgi:CheY-like chemotaxis protein